MKNSRWHRWKRNERERLKVKTPGGRFVQDLSDWQLSARRAAQKKKEQTSA